MEDISEVRIGTHNALINITTETCKLKEFQHTLDQCGSKAYNFTLNHDLFGRDLQSVHEACKKLHDQANLIIELINNLQQSTIALVGKLMSNRHSKVHEEEVRRRSSSFEVARPVCISKGAGDAQQAKLLFNKSVWPTKLMSKI